MGRGSPDLYFCFYVFIYSPFARGKKVGVLPPSATSGSTLGARLSRMATKGLVLDSRSGERYLATKIKSNKEKNYTDKWTLSEVT